MNIWLSFLILLLGIFLGSIFYKKSEVQYIVPKVLHYIIYIVLFFLGAELGTLPNFFEECLRLGKQAFITSTVCVFASSIAGSIIWHFFIKKKS